MNQPISLTLRPATISDLLDQTFRIYRNNFVEILKLMIAVMTPITILTILFDTQNANLTLSERSASLFGTPFGVLAFTLIVGLIQTVVVNGTLTYMASEAYLGRKVTAAEAFLGARSRFVSLGVGMIRIYILIGIILFGASLLVGLIIGLPLLGFFAYIIFTGYALAIPTLTLERTRVVAGLNRGTMLTRARFWPVLAVLGAIFIITTIISVALGFASSYAIVLVIPYQTFSAIEAAQVVVQALISVLIAPALPIGATLAYYDARVRLEGLDIALQSAGRPDARPSDVDSPPANLRLVRSDWVNIAILTAAGIALGLVGWATLQALIRNFAL